MQELIIDKIEEEIKNEYIMEKKITKSMIWRTVRAV
jgi:hypothetical protein